MKSPSISFFVRGVLLGVVIASSLIPLAAGPAAATPPSSCRAFKDNVEAHQGTVLGSHIGLRSDVWLGTSANDCARISSLTDTSSSGFVEFGWLLGWDQCGPTNDYHVAPLGFIAWQPNAGGYHCAEVATWSGGQFSTLSLKDENSNTIWGAYRDMSLTATMDVNFDRGTANTNGERHASGDSAWSHFKSLDWMPAGTTTWNQFSVLESGPDTDPNYNCIQISEHEQKVTTDPTSC